MALPDTHLLQSGTAIVLANTGEHSPAAGNNLGTRTDQIDLDSLAAGAYRQSAKVDLGANRARVWSITGAFEFSVAPTATGTISVWMGFSHSATAGTGNPGNLSGSDAAYTGYGGAASDADEAIDQLTFVGLMPVSNDADIHVGHLGLFVPKQRYGILVVKNGADQSFIADAVEMSIRLQPLEDITVE